MKRKIRYALLGAGIVFFVYAALFFAINNMFFLSILTLPFSDIYSRIMGYPTIPIGPFFLSVGTYILIGAAIGYAIGAYHETRSK